ncbi:MAG: hypothetical protein AAGA21_02835 [Pseudomonadota bacterium]
MTSSAVTAAVGIGVIQSLITGQDAIFRCSDLASLQAEILEQLVIQRAEMLLLMVTRGAHVLSMHRPQTATDQSREWLESSTNPLPKRHCNRRI